MNERKRLHALLRGWSESGAFRVQTAKEDLIVDPVVDADRVWLSDSIDLLATIGYDLGIPPSGMKVEGATLILKRSDEHEAILHLLLQEMRDTASPLSPDQFVMEDFSALFGLSERDIDRIVSWMRFKELEALTVSPARTFITFSGNVLEFEAAFHSELHRYRFEGREYLANACELSIPAALAPVVSGVDLGN